MPEIQFTVRGQVVPASGVKQHLDKAAPKTRAEAEARHDGFAVMGFAPGAIKAAEDAANKACADWDALSQHRKADALKEGQRPPKPWIGEERYAATAKKKRVCKPFSIPDSADLCRDIAEKNGWQYVVVVELRKGAKE